MPVRSSVCTYSPSSVLNSKYSTVLPSPSPLSVGHYKPLPSSQLVQGSNASSYRRSSVVSSALRSPGRYATSSSSSYSPSTYSSLSSYSPSSYRNLVSSPDSFNASRHDGSSTASSYKRYSSSSSIGSISSTSLSSTNSLLDRTDTSAGGHSSSLSSYHYKPRTLSSARLSNTRSDADPLPSDVPKGLINLGNTCYMNSAIQSLYSIESFRNLILKVPHDKRLAVELADLFKSMTNSSGPVSPANFKNLFSRLQPKFSGLGQQDAQEFLRYLINGVHEELNRATRRPRRSASPRAPKAADEAWSQYRDIVDDSPLVDLLVGQMCSTIVCCVCQNKSSCWDPFWDLSLPLARGRHSCRLSDVVQDFIAKETLDSDERPICSNCKKATRSTKQIKLSRLPQVMILHLKKFTNDGYKLTSSEVKIDRVLTFNENTTYTLKACISHHGHSSSSGHYTSHCEYGTKWIHFNDDRVKDVTSSFDSVNINDAYVLFYTQSTAPSKL